MSQKTSILEKGLLRPARILVLRHWAKLFGEKPQKRDVSKNTLEIRQNAYKAAMPDLVTTDCDSDYDYPDDDEDRPQGRGGSSSETEGIVLKHPRIKAKRRQGIYAGRRKDRNPILFAPDCQRP